MADSLIRERDEAVAPYVQYVIYEIQMLTQLPPWIEKFDVEGPAVLKNACLESYLLHARTIIEFLMGRPGKSGRRRRHRDDVRVKMFCDWAAPDESAFDSVLREIDRHLSHLSKHRADATGEGGIEWAISLGDALLVHLDALAQRMLRAGSVHAHAIDAACHPVTG